MKKSLQLFFILGVCSSVNGQQKNISTAKLLPIKHPRVNQGRPCPLFKGVYGEHSVPFSMSHQKNETVSASNKTEWEWYTEQEVGETRYDIQTNSAVKNHIVNNADGTIAIVWTTAHSTSPYDDRGTGYNYFNGTSFGTVTDARIEGDRVGYTNIVHTASGKEYVLAHNTNKNQLHKSYRAVKGTGVWSSDTVLKSPHPYGVFWPAIAVGGANGETIHAIAISYPTKGQTSGADTVYYNGQIGAILYSRSTDGGLTWGIAQDTLPLIGPRFYGGFSADDYTIDAKGDTVVIVAGGMQNDVVMLKSVDNGNTWVKTVIFPHPLPKYSYHTMSSDTGLKDGVADTLETNDGSISVLIDHTGLVHVAFGRQRMLGEAPGKIVNFPFTDGLYYWHEGQTAANIIAGLKDIDGDGTFTFNQVEGDIIFPFGLYSGQGLTSFPSMGVDANNNIYLSYSSLAEKTYSAINKTYRHQFIMRKKDSPSEEWWPSLDITENYKADQLAALPVVEAVYGSIARRVDSHVHVTYQRDDAPGMGVPLDGGSEDEKYNTSVNSIVYVKVPVANLINDVGISEKKGKLSAVDIYPNPSSDIVNLVIRSASAEKARITVSDILGQQMTMFSKDMNAGLNTVKLDVERFNTGIYFVKTEIGNSSVTTKIVVE